MKKLFLIPLMTLMTCVMAWGDTDASTFGGLKNVIETGNEPVVTLTQDVVIRSTSANSCINIKRSVTIDGQGHSITGYACRATNTTNGTLIAINHDGTDSVDVVIKNLNLIDEKLRAIETRGKIRSLTLENCTIKATKSSGYQQPITIGGNQASVAKINITNCHIEALKYYPIITFNPLNLTMTNSSTKGWCSVYFKGIDSSAGSNGTTMVATNCVFDAQNNNTGFSNSFGAFVLEDDGINVTLDNCQINCVAHDPSGVAGQTAFCLSSWKEILSTRQGYGMHLEPCEFIIKGASTEIVGNLLSNKWTGTIAECPVSFTVYGGTFDEDLTGKFDVATGYHVNVLPTVKGGEDITLYRVVKDAQEKSEGVMYDLNDYVPVEGEGYGDNPVSSFDLSTGTEMELNQETTTAGYVQVSNNVVTDEVTGDTISSTPTTVQVGKVENEGTPEEEKVNQTLIINSGLDVQGESQVLVQSGSALIIGEGGIVTEKPENIVIESTEEEQAVLLLDPAVIVNENPNLTVRLVTNSKQVRANEYTYQRIAIPTLSVANAPANDFESAGHTIYPGYASFKTYIYYWSGHAWDPITAWSQLQPFVGYQMSNNSSDGGVVYTFQGQLVGNNDGEYEFTSRGFDFFGNSYTAPIQIGKLLDGFNGDVEASVWLYDYEHKNWAIITKDDIEFPEFAFATEIKSMDGFILNLRGANSGVANMSYADAIWDNPRINPNAPSAGAGAPARVAASNIDNSVIINVAAENGVGDRLTLVEKSTNDASFENGSDASKFLNETGVNLYAVTPAGNLSRVATNDLAGTLITFENNESVQFTMTFSAVNGTSYALRDNVTGQIIELVNGGTYSFSQTANTSVAGRFEIVYAPQVTTAIDNIEAKGNVKGIYTVLGQYIGENSMWNTLPAGIYVVDGVKIVK